MALSEARFTCLPVPSPLKAALIARVAAAYPHDEKLEQGQRLQSRMMRFVL